MPRCPSLGAMMAASETPTTPDLARVRTDLANERTLLAYLRTALMLMATGVSLVQFMDDDSRLVWLGWLSSIVGTLVLVIGVQRFASLKRRLDERKAG
ncbi:MAG: DUF202 domain-containing protein [Planctomycetota bacterium]